MMSFEIFLFSEVKYIVSFGFDFDNKLQSMWEIFYVLWNVYDKKMEDFSIFLVFVDFFVLLFFEGK